MKSVDLLIERQLNKRMYEREQMKVRRLAHSGGFSNGIMLNFEQIYYEITVAKSISMHYNALVKLADLALSRMEHENKLLLWRKHVKRRLVRDVIEGIDLQPRYFAKRLKSAEHEFDMEVKRILRSHRDSKKVFCEKEDFIIDNAQLEINN